MILGQGGQADHRVLVTRADRLLVRRPAASSPPVFPAKTVWIGLRVK
jgi:hypothetical protein